MKRNKKRNFFLVLVCSLIILMGNAASADEELNKVNERLTQIEEILRKNGLLRLSSDLDKLKDDQRSLKGRVEEIEFFIDSQKVDDTSLSSQGKREPIGILTDELDKNNDAPEILDEGLNMAAVDDNILSDNIELTSGEIYKQSFALLKAADYENAIIGFREYLSKHGDGKYADNSMFWIGEAYWVTQDYEKAIAEYTELMKVYPKSQKSSHAMLKIGYCYEKLGKKAEATKALEDLQKEFPNSTAARLGVVKLEKLKKDLN